MKKSISTTKSLLVASMALLSTSVMAGEGAGTVSFGTVNDVSVTQSEALHFGDNYLLTQGISCALTYNGIIDTTNSSLTIKEGATAARTGAACLVTPSSTIPTGGMFIIEGAATQTVNVRVTGASENDLTFVAAGDVITGHPTNDAFATLTNAATTFADSAQVAVQLSTGIDSVGGASSTGYATVFVGGTLTADQALPTLQTLTVNYNVEVTY